MSQDSLLQVIKDLCLIHKPGQEPTLDDVLSMIQHIISLS